MRIGIVGMGWVGTSVAVSVLHTGCARELWLCDVREGLAEGEAMDLSHGASFLPPCEVRAVELSQLAACDAVVIAAGRGGTADESRLDLNRDNAAIVAAIAEALRSLRGLLVVVTNPVDVMTRVAQEASGLDPARVIGTGTMLETARLRYALGRDLGLNPRTLHAQVIGEHGDSAVALWSSATAGGSLLRDWLDWDRSRESAWADEVRQAAYEIIRRKGATNHAIGLVTASLLRWALGGEPRILTVSRVHEVHDGVALSLPTVVGPAGAQRVLTPRMDGAEVEALARSAAVLADAYAALQR